MSPSEFCAMMYEIGPRALYKLLYENNLWHRAPERGAFAG